MSESTIEPPLSSRDGKPRSGAFARFAALPGWARWSLAATIGILLLAIVQDLSGTESLTTTLSSQTALKWSMPVLIAGIGGLFSERSGVVNIGLEGMMVFGTWFAAWGAIDGTLWGPLDGSPWTGLMWATIAGALGGLLHAIATVHFGVDQIVSGVAINLLGPGLSRYLSERIFVNYQGGSQTQSPRVGGLGDFTMPFLAGGRIGDWKSPDLLGSIENSDAFFFSDAAGLLRGTMFELRYFTVLGLILTAVAAWVLWRTRFGLRLRTSGEAPSAGESLGVNIYTYRYAGVVISGALAGMAGGFIVLELAQLYRGGQTQGRGFIALAALIFGNWRAAGVLGGALLFSYPLGLSFGLDDEKTTRALLLVIALAMVLLALSKLSQQKRTDAMIAAAIGAGSFIWFLLSDEAPSWLPNTMPFAVVLIVLVFASENLRSPRALGIPYRRGGT